ncbi:MAG: PQQ-binding-like beta-propeller repeat protein [Armatimonadetes bacterium]|nr:PQQ-binding-like beta-propeller repeat protein [Armatimonadota bacterium]
MGSGCSPKQLLMLVNKSGLVITLVMVIAACAALAGENDWSMARYDEAQTGYTPQKLAVPLTLSWQHNTTKFSQNASTPAVVGGTAYFASGNRVYAVDTATGTFKWQYPSADALRFNIRTGMTVWEDLVIFGGTDGNIYALRTADGRIAWTFPTRGSIRSTPVVSGGVVFIGSDDNNLYAIDARSGELSWKGGFRTRDDITAPAAIAPGLVIFASMSTHVYGANEASGAVRWDFRLPMSPVRSAPVVDGNIVYIGAGNKIYALSTKNGQLRYSIFLQSDIASPVAVANGDVYVICRNQKMYAYTAGLSACKPKWSAAVDIGLSTVAPPTIAGDLIFVGCNKGMICAYSAEDGSLVWRYTIAPSAVGNNNQRSDFTNIAAPLVVAENALFALSDDGSLHCFRPQSADSTPPKIYNINPAPGTAMNGSPPILISAILYDESTGVDQNSIQIKLDDETVDHTFDITTLTLSYQTPVTRPLRPLRDGRHFVTVLAKDWKGNQLEHKWSFIVDNTLAPKAIPKSMRRDEKEDDSKNTRRRRRRQPPPQPQPQPGAQPQPGPGTEGPPGSPGDMLPPPPPGMDMPMPPGMDMPMPPGGPGPAPGPPGPAPGPYMTPFPG